MNKTEHAIFLDFPDWNVKAWKEKLNKELKGNASKAIAIEVEPGVISSAYPYDHPILPVNGFEPPYRRGVIKDNNASKIRQAIVNLSNEDILRALKGGANSLGIYSENAKTLNLETLFKGVFPEMIELNFSTEEPLETISIFKKWLKENESKLSEVSGSIEYDPLTDYLTNRSSSKEISYDYFNSLHDALQAKSSFRCIEVNTSIYDSSALSVAWTLAFSLAHANEHFKKLSAHDIDVLSGRIQFKFSHGTQFFIEIAKLRAFRILWSNLVAAYKPKHQCSHLPYVLSVPNKIAIPERTPETNIMRLTTMAMSAMIGGSDSLELSMPKLIDEELTQRICRNVSLILQEESFIQKVLDPVGGSFYIENLTDVIAETAWMNFQKIENAGGIIPFIEEEETQKFMKQCAENYCDQINQGTRIVVGANKYFADDQTPLQLKVDIKTGRIPKLFWSHE